MIRALRSSTLGLMLIASLSAHAESSRDDASLSFDGMPRVESRYFAYVWAKPDAHFAGYKKLLVLPAEISYKRKSRKGASVTENFELTDAQMKRLREMLYEAFKKELVDKGGWEMTDQPGPDVMLVRGGLIDLVVNVPERHGRVTYFVDTFGEATLVIEFYDSQTREILARVADRRAAKPFGNQMGTDLEAPGEVRRAFGIWAKRLREGLDHAKELRP